MFTKRHYEAIAKSIKPVYQEVLKTSIVNDKLSVVGDIVENLCKAFRKDNPNFDSVVFSKAITG